MKLVMKRWFARVAAMVLTGGLSVICTTAAAVDDDSVPLIAGRVAAVEGQVDIWRNEEDGDGQWDEAEVNDVVTAGTGLATATGARVELRVGPHAFRLAGASSGGFSQLDFSAKVFSLERGVAGVQLASAQQGELVAVVAGGVQVDLSAPGRYRIDAIDGAPLRISVFQGQVTARYNGNDVAVGAGQALVLTQSSVNYAVASTSPFDEWGATRDQRYLAAMQAQPEVSAYMTGAEELAGHGDWTSDASLGALWIPRAVPIGWAPYRAGRWRWVAPWGWSWVDAAPWGYAPFHYGRWVFLGGRWGWAPGRFVARPIWAPALVGFVGGGVVVGGPVGWHPLAPWNPYRPHFRASNKYLAAINQSVIHRPPPGLPPTINHGSGSTWVPGPRFRDPVPRTAMMPPANAASLQPMVPPPRPVARTIGFADGPPSRARPALPGAVPPREFARGAARSIAQAPPSFSGSPTPLPGNEPGLRQPPPLRRVEPVTVPPAAPIPQRDVPPPRRAYIPQDQQPPGRARTVPAPAEPAVYPPGSVPIPRAPGAAQNPRNIRPPTVQRPSNPSTTPPPPSPRLVGPVTQQPTQIAPLPDLPRATPTPAPPQTAPAPPAARAPATAPSDRGKPGNGVRSFGMDR